MVAIKRPIKIEVQAWVLGSLAVHASVAVRGLTITHIPSGQRIQSRCNTKEQALEAVQRLLALSDCDWTNCRPLTEENKEVIQQIVNAIPKRNSRRNRRPSTAGLSQEGL